MYFLISTSDFSILDVKFKKFFKKQHSVVVPWISIFSYFSEDILVSFLFF